MEFTEVIMNRYSCKKYSDRKIPGEILERILEAGRVAPTAKNSQEQRIYVLESEESLKMFDSLCPCRYGAPIVLVVAYDKNGVFVYPGGDRDSGAEDASIVATQMMLAAYDAGVDSCWLNYLEAGKLEKEMGLPENERIVMALDLGYAAEGAGPLPNQFSRKDLKETVEYR